MKLLSILASGGAFWGLTGVAVFLISIFIYQLIGGSKNGTYVNDGAGGSVSSDKNKPWYRNTFFWLSVIVAALYIGSLLILKSDYKSVSK